jgi:3-phenylpropionate/cinnamic acid dioxygenase small subunit
VVDSSFHQRLTALNAEYARCIDDDRIETWPEFFFDECLYKITTAENYQKGLEAGIIYADSKAMLQDRVSALREANIYERQRYRHIIGTAAIVGEAGGVVRAESPFLVTRIMRDGRMDVFATGKYVDAVREDGSRALKFVERIVVCDSTRFDTLVALPL